MYNKIWDILVYNIYVFILSPRDVIFLNFRMPFRGPTEMQFSIVMFVVFHMIAYATGTYWDSYWREMEGYRRTSIQSIFLQLLTIFQEHPALPAKRLLSSILAIILSRRRIQMKILRNKTILCNKKMSTQSLRTRIWRRLEQSTTLQFLRGYFSKNLNHLNTFRRMVTEKIRFTPTPNVAIRIFWANAVDDGRKYFSCLSCATWLVVFDTLVF